MNLSNFNPLSSLRQRLGAVLAIFATSLACCVCGALMTFVFAPGQALEASRMSRLPVIVNVAAVQAVPAGQDILVAGMLTGNTPVLEETDFVAYAEEEWQVTVPSRDDADSPGEPYGVWKMVKTVIPELTLELAGEDVGLHAASSARLSGPLHEQIIAGQGSAAKYNGKPLPGGTRRYRGLVDGDPATVLGKKSADGGVAPEQLFAGDRAAFEESQRQAAAGLLFSGIILMILSPFVLVGGILGALFRRR